MIRHEALLFDNCQKAREQIVEYRKKQLDSVHFNDKVYLEIVNRLLVQARELLTSRDG